MFSLMRQRRQAERHKKLEEAFREADVDGSGRITPEQMVKLFAAHEVTVPNLETEARKLAGRDGFIQLGEFLKFSDDTNLCRGEHVHKDRVFHRPEPEKKGARAGGSSSKAKVRMLTMLCSVF